MEKSIPEILVTAPGKEELRGDDLRNLINKELARFSLLLTERNVGGALSNAEKALLSTYIAWKIVEDGAKKEEPDSGPLLAHSFVRANTFMPHIWGVYSSIFPRK